MAEFRLPKNSRITKGKSFPAPEGAARTKTFRVYRWDPDDGNNPRVDSFDVDLDSCDDCSSGVDDPNDDGADFDGDGACDAGDPDDPVG